VTVDLVGTSDIAQILGVSRQRANELTKRDGFPTPLATVNTRINVWSRQAVLEWVDGHRYGITPAPRP
jgi:predicted DNA-binding transcriptional regulator AlpA